jgi:hypothetical protein
MTHRAFEEGSFRMTQSALEACSTPMTQYAFESISVHLTHCGIEPFLPLTIGEFKLHYIALRPVDITVGFLLH